MLDSCAEPLVPPGSACRDMDIDKLYGLLNRRFRAKRMADFLERMGLTPHTRVLDVGGTPVVWSHVPTLPKLTLVNLTATPGLRGASQVIGDGTRLPFRDDSFDIAFSNSVIEHVGGRDRQYLFASELRRVGRRFYVQTPNRWFPFEPHLLTPVIHFMPKGWQRRLIRNCTAWGVFTRPTQATVNEFVRTTRLLDAREMRRLFPGGEIVRERFLHLTKSLVATGAGITD